MRKPLFLIPTEGLTREQMHEAVDKALGTKMPNLTIKRVLRRLKKFPQDKELHEKIEKESVSKDEFMGLITKAVK